MIKIGEGKAHEVYQENPGYVRKIPKTGEELSYEDALNAVEYFGEKFGKLCPPTKIIKRESQSYIAVQKQVFGKPLKESKPIELSNESLNQLLDFVNRAEKILSSNESFDYIGFQGALFEQKRHSNKYIDIYYRIHFLVAVFMRFQTIFNSTNLMLSESGDIYYTDNVGELRSNILEKSFMKKIKILLMKKYKLDIMIIKARNNIGGKKMSS